MTIAEFARAAAGLKTLKRAGWADKLSIADGESVADHSYLTAIIGMILSDKIGLNSERVIRMALLHDLAESRIGDIVPGQIPSMEKMRIENEAFADIVSALPDALKLEYTHIWNELRAGVTPEARLVRQADKLDMALQASIYEKTGRATGSDILPFVEAAKKSAADGAARNLFLEIVSARSHDCGCVGSSVGGHGAAGSNDDSGAGNGSSV